MTVLRVVVLISLMAFTVTASRNLRRLPVRLLFRQRFHSYLLPLMSWKTMTMTFG